MRVATWCIGGVRARLELLCHWLEHRKPHVVALQKIQAPAKVFPADALRQAGYWSKSLCRPGSFGVALLVRRNLALPKQPQVLCQGLPGGDDQDDRLLTVRIEDLVVSSVYAPWADRKLHGFAGAVALKIAWLDRLIAHVKEARVAPDRSMLCGDFNVLPDDCPQRRVLGRTPKEKQRLEALLATGFEDLYRCVHRSDPGLNYGFNPKTPPTSRLQLLLGSRNVAGSVQSARVDMEYRAPLEDLPGRKWSSCAPVIVELGGQA
ncbi:MAG: hypothetical protein F4X59_18185 [Holophagales bacterium]|nr:hypothetical protein [Holophagales bacterium]MYC12033.1 hypothetical protein [Holophagales bacterium]